ARTNLLLQRRTQRSQRHRLNRQHVSTRNRRLKTPTTKRTNITLSSVPNRLIQTLLAHRQMSQRTISNLTRQHRISSNRLIRRSQYQARRRDTLASQHVIKVLRARLAINHNRRTITPPVNQPLRKLRRASTHRLRRQRLNMHHIIHQQPTPTPVPTTSRKNLTTDSNATPSP